MKRVFAVLGIFASIGMIFAQPLSGDYTLGGNSPDFVSFSAVLDVLESQGVSGAVNINIRQGIYQENGGAERVIFMDQNITGATSDQRITFRPDAASGATRDNVILRRESGDYELGRGFVVEIRCDYVTLQDLSIEFADTVGSAGDFSCVGLTSIPGGNLVEGVSIIGCRIFSSGARLRQGIGATGGGDKILINNNQVEKVYWGIFCYGSNLNYTDLVISENTISDLSYIFLTSFYGSAIEVLYGTNAIIRGNKISYEDGTGIVGIRIANNSTGTIVQENLITLGRGWGYPCNGFDAIKLESGASNVTIVNNMIGGILASGGRGIVASGNNHQILYNTITHGYGSALFGCQPTVLTLSGTGHTVKNNIFVQHKSTPQPGYVMNIADTTGNVFDYNVIYQSLETRKLIFANGQLYDSLEAWQAEGHDIHSVNKLPQFVDEFTDLHLAGCSIFDPELTGIPIASFVSDYDGEVRDQLAPTMGADEAGGVLPVAFTQPESYATGDDVLHFTSADLDGDNDADIAVSNLASGSNDVSIFWNNGDGNLAAPNHITFGENPGLLQAADLDGDNSNDLVAVTGSADPVTTVRWGNPGGSFDTEEQLEFFKPVEGLLMADMRNYGYLDIVQTHLGVVGVDDGDLSVLLNGGGNGRSFIRANMGPYNPGQHPSAVVAGKLNGDDYPDLAVIDYINNSVSVLINKGADGPIWNGLEQGVQYPVFAGSSSLHANLAVADIDMDGNPDLLVGGEWGIGVDSLGLLRNQGDGTFSGAEKIPLDTRNRSETFAVLDYDGDGDPDLVTANVTRNLSLFLNDGFGNFDKFLLCQNSDLSGEPLTILSDHFNNDNDADIAVLTITDDVEMFFNQRWVPTGIGHRQPDNVQPVVFELQQNYPNPFNPSTTIAFQLRAASMVTLVIFDNIGRHVETLYRASLHAGTHKFVWNGTDAAGNLLPSGLYFYRVTVGQFSQTRRMLLIK